jgi:hypothetical protein
MSSAEQATDLNNMTTGLNGGIARYSAFSTRLLIVLSGNAHTIQPGETPVKFIVPNVSIGFIDG